MEGRVQELRWDAEPAEHFDREVSEIRVPAKGSTNNHEQDPINRRHDDQGADPVRPWTVLNATVDSEPIRNSGSNKL